MGAAPVFYFVFRIVFGQTTSLFLTVTPEKNIYVWSSWLYRK